nr:hypothetical protein [Tanacetum cinerariifolium]
DGKKIIVNEASIRRDLRLDDAEGPEEVGEIPTDTQDTPILTQPSSSQPIGSINLEESRGRKLSENVEQDVTVTEKEVSAAANEVVTTTKSDKEVARKLDAQMKAEIEEEERIAREKDEAKRDVIKEWDDVQATIDADRQLAEQLQAQEREHLSIEERSKLLAKLIESRRKYFAAKRAEEIRNKPPKKAQQKSLMCTYMKNMEGYMQKDFKGKSFNAIKKMLDQEYKRVNTFVAMDLEVMEGSKKTQAEVTKGSSKRAGDKIEQESAKRQRLEKENDIPELKRCLEIVFEYDDDVTIEATPLSSKSPTIVDYKIYKEGKKSHFKIIKAYENSQNYLTFRTMFKNFNREDLEVLKSIVKERFKKTKPVNDMDNLLFQTLKTMFEHYVKDNIWKYQQGVVKVLN